MRQSINRVFSAVCVLLILTVTVSTVRATGKEFFTDEEVDFIRDAQGLPLRITALLKLANIRMVTLGMKEKSKDDRDLEKKIATIRDNIDGIPPKPEKKPDKQKPDAEVSHAYLDDYSRVELLHGYVEALEEATDDIDDAYRDRKDVRGSLEQIEKFCTAALPLLHRFQPGSNAERSALEDAQSTTQEKLEAAHAALGKTPKTEKNGKP